MLGTKIAQAVLGLVALGFMLASVTISCMATASAATSGTEVLVDCITFGLCLATFVTCLIRRIAGWDATDKVFIPNIYLWIFNTVLWAGVMAQTLSSAGLL